MHFITIATIDYAIHALRLVRSLRQQYPKSLITVYCDSADFPLDFSSMDAQLRVLPQINTLGVKRAKFWAYADAAMKGGFIYLDADILVINDLPGLLEVDNFTACRDDLSECQFISNPSNPWEGEPSLSGEKYFNSGVFAVPAGFAELFEIIKDDSADDGQWERYTIPGRLYDNHFLCAKLAKYHIAVNFISEYEYNWQGFRSFGKLNCYVDSSGRLRNMQTEKYLRLVHFAGIGDIDNFVAALPFEIAQVLARSIGVVVSGVLEVINIGLNAKCGIEPRLKTIMAQAICQNRAGEVLKPGTEISLLGHQASVASIAHSVKEDGFLWNNLKCGSAYLSAAEYQRLRSFVVESKVQAVLEFGAGYTSALFKRLGCKQVAIEGWGGPWLEFARGSGATARLVAFVDGAGFDEHEFISCVEEAFSANGKKLVFVDSPPGKDNRSCVVEQIIRMASDCDFYVVHDSVRDSSVVYRLCSALGLVVVDHFPSIRGLTFLGKPGANAFKPQLQAGDLVKRTASMCFDVRRGKEPHPKCDEGKKIFIDVINIGEEVISLASDDLGFSVHLADEHGQMLHWDTPRYRLPVDLYPADQISFWIDLSSFSFSRAVLLFDFVKEGEFWWSDISSCSYPKIIVDM